MVSLLELEKKRAIDELNEVKVAAALVEERLSSELETVKIAKSRADANERDRKQLEAQIRDLREAHTNVVGAKTDVEGLLMESQRNLESARAELYGLQNKTIELQSSFADATQVKPLQEEVELLRNQLVSMRQNVLNESMNVEANNLDPRLMSEKHENTKKVYEGIVFELRKEIDRLQVAGEERSKQIQTLRQKAIQATSLSDEVELLKNSARMSALQTHSVQASASEIEDRLKRTSHERASYQRELKLVEENLSDLKIESTCLAENLAETKSNLKAEHIEKLAAERKSAELIAINARAESVIYQLRLSLEEKETNIERLTILNRDLSTSIETVKAKSIDVRSMQQENDELRSELDRVMKNASTREQELSGEVSRMKMSNETIALELTMAQERIAALSSSLRENSNTLESVRSDLLENRREIEQRNMQESSHRGSKAEEQIRLLRDDLNETMSSFHEAKLHKLKEQDDLMKVMRDLAREREKCGILQTQVHSLDTKLNAARDELAIFRSLDVYHTSMQSELSHYRTKGENDGSHKLRSAQPPSIDIHTPRMFSERDDVDSSHKSIKFDSDMEILDLSVSREDRLSVGQLQDDIALQKKGTELDRSRDETTVRRRLRRQKVNSEEFHIFRSNEKVNGRSRVDGFPTQLPSSKISTTNFTTDAFPASQSHLRHAHEANIPSKAVPPRMNFEKAKKILSSH
jgi:chromosome segregation ATPase